MVSSCLEYRLSSLCYNNRQLIDEVNLMEMVTSDLHSPVVLCHNDLVPGNIIYDEKRGELLFAKKHLHL